jgi:hypothetical protein
VLLFYPTESEARDAGYTDYPRDSIVDGQVCKFRGVKADARERFCAIRDQKERRVHLHQIRHITDASFLLRDAGSIILATGYTPEKFPILDSFGEEVGPLTTLPQGHWGVTQSGKVRTFRSEVMQRLYSLGMGRTHEDREGLKEYQRVASEILSDLSTSSHFS